MTPTPRTGPNGHVYIISAAPMPIVKFGGALSTTAAVELGGSLATLRLGGGGSVAAAFERV